MSIKDKKSQIEQNLLLQRFFRDNGVPEEMVDKFVYEVRRYLDQIAQEVEKEIKRKILKGIDLYLEEERQKIKRAPIDRAKDMHDENWLELFRKHVERYINYAHSLKQQEKERGLYEI